MGDALAGAPVEILLVAFEERLAFITAASVSVMADMAVPLL
jgi:hypothetical protein